MTARLDNLSRSLPALQFYDLSSVWKSLCSYFYPCSCTVFILHKGVVLWGSWSSLPSVKKAINDQVCAEIRLLVSHCITQEHGLRQNCSAVRSTPQSSVLYRPQCLILPVKCQIHKEVFPWISLKFLHPPLLSLSYFHLFTHRWLTFPGPPCCSVLQVGVPIASFPTAFGATEGVNTCAEVRSRTRDRLGLWEGRTDWRRGRRLCWPYHNLEHKLKFVKTLMGEFNTEIRGNAKNISDSLLPAVSRNNMPVHTTHSQP